MKNPICKGLLASLILLFLSGCAGKIVTSEFEKGKVDGVLDGVVFRILEPQKEYFSYTATLSNKVLSNNCSPKLLSRIIDAPSSKLYSVGYEAALFEKHKFSVTLNENGTLNNVNSESTPASPTELLEIAKGAVGIGLTLNILAKKNEGKAPPCNQDPKMIFRRCSINDNDAAINGNDAAINGNDAVKEASCQKQAREDFEKWNNAI